MKKIIISILFTGCSLIGFTQKEISGITPEKTISIEGKTLKFNGAGLREKFFLDLYVGSLYLTTSTKDANAVINSDEPMAITIDIVSGLINSDKMISAINEGFEKSTKGNTKPLETKIKEFKNAFSEAIVKGDDFTVSYVPSKGTQVYKKGKLIKTIDGIDFKKAVFGIWFCDEPADEDLMESMLGLD